MVVSLFKKPKDLQQVAGSAQDPEPAMVSLVPDPPQKEVKTLGPAYSGIEIIHSTSCKHHPGNRKVSCRDEYGTGKCTIQIGYTDLTRAAKKVRITRNEHGVPYRTLTEAKNHLIDLKSKKQNGRLPVPSTDTVEDACNKWWDLYNQGLALTIDDEQFKRNSVAAYERCIRLRIKPLIGSKRLSRLHHRDIQHDLVDPLRATCSRATIQQTITALSAVLDQPIADGLLLDDPTKGKFKIQKDAKPRDRVIQPVELDELLDPLPHDLKVLYAMAATTTLRRGEMRGLRWGDVNLETSIVSVRADGGWDDKLGRISPKSKSSIRQAFIEPMLRHLLIEHKLACPWSDDPDGLVFGRTATVPFATTTVDERATKAWKKANLEREKNGLPPLNRFCFHEGRHTAITLMHDEELPPGQVKDVAGHSTLQMNDHYRHPLDQQLQRAAERMGAYRESALKKEA